MRPPRGSSATALTARAFWPLAVSLSVLVATVPACSNDGDSATAAAADTEQASDASATDSSTLDTTISDVAGDADPDTSADTTHKNPDSPGFSQGCPKPGRSLVRQIKGKHERFSGPAALAAPGDWLLANEHAAFVIKSPTETEHTYAYYGGLLVDAVAIDGCAQVAPERFGELPFLVGNIDISNFTATVLRTFRGESAEVLADGSDGGPAKLRVWGTDDRFWLVELTLIGQALKAGSPRGRTKPLGVKLALDYTLAPDRAAIRIDLVVFNETATPRELHCGAAAFLHDSTVQQIWSAGKLGAGGFSLRTGLPWLAGSAADGSVAIAVDAKNLGTAQFSGVDALVPIDQLGEPLKLGAKGGGADSDMQTFWIGVGKTDSASAVASLEGLTVGGSSWQGQDVSGHVRDVGSGDSIAGAQVVLQRRSGSGQFDTLLSERSGADGAFTMRVPKVGKAGDLRLLAHKSGRADSAAVVLVLDSGPVTNVELKIGQLGRIEHEVTDETGAFIPARLTLLRKGGGGVLGFAKGEKGIWEVPPGAYTLHVTHGYTHTPWQGEVVVKAGAPAKVKAKVPRVVDTKGWFSFDNHVHSEPSPDSTVPLTDRYISAAAEGLDVVVHSEHEIIVDSSPALAASGVAKWVRGVVGQEVTASLPEHTNMTSVVPDPKHVRGAPVSWEGHDLAEIFALEKQRGAGFRTLNHPRKGCNWLCLIGWDRDKLTFTLNDPTVVGLAKGATLLSWDFEAMEVLNGMDDRLFSIKGKEQESGTFEDWLSFWNGGHRVVGLAVTDVHGWAPPGSPRSWFKVPSDTLADFEDAWLVDAVKSGNTTMSAGAFATVSIGGVGPGGTVPKSAVVDGKVPLAVKVQAIAAIDVTRVAVLVNCELVLDVKTSAPDAVVKMAETLSVPITKDSYVVVLGFGKKAMPAGFAGVNAAAVPRFIANPILVDADGNGSWSAPGAKSCGLAF